MSDRYAAMFDRLAQRGEGALGAFVMLGDPDFETSPSILDALIEGGADMIEVGIPFSDPIADGPVIQGAADRALAAGVTPRAALSLLEAFRARHPTIPVGVLTYANLVLARGRDEFYRKCAQAGVDSVLVADVPAMEAEPFVRAASHHGIAPVLIAAANTPRRTLERIAALGRAYTYCVTRAGVTGAGSGDVLRFDHRTMFDALAELGAPPPILGFGISTPGHVRAALASGATGVISGSAIVAIVAENAPDRPERIRGFVASLKAATI